MEIRDYIQIIWKRKYLILLSLFVIGFAGVVLNYAVLPVKYQAAAKILVEPRAKVVVFTADNPRNMPPSLDIDTYVKMLKSHQVGQLAAKKLNLQNPESTGASLVDKVVVAAEEDTGIIRITMNDQNPKICTDYANAYAAAFEEFSKNMAQTSLAETERYVKEQIEIADRNLKDQSAKIERFQNKILKLYDTTNPTHQEGELSDIIRELGSEQLRTQIEVEEFNKRLAGFQQLNAEYDNTLRQGQGDTPGWKFLDAGGQQLDYADSQLRELELELISLRNKYVDGHPKIKEVQDKIRNLEQEKEDRVRAIYEGKLISNERYSYVHGKVEELAVEAKLSADKLARINENLKAEKERMANIPSMKKEQAQLDRELAVAETLKNTLEEQLMQIHMQSVEQPTRVRVLDQALEPKEPISPNRKRNIIIFCVVGLLVGVGAAFLLEEMEETIRTSDDVKNYLNLPVLGSIPYSAETINKLITDVPLKSPIAEAYRRLSFFTQLFCLDPPIKSLLVTSSKSDEGKSTTLANMAISMAQEGTKVLLVDTDLRRPMLHRMFGIDNSLGLSSILTGELEAEIAVSDMSVSGRLPKESFMDVVVDRLIQSANIKGLSIIPSGPLPANSIELLRSERMLSFLRTAEKKADIVIFDSPPSIHVIDAVVLSQILDGVLFVINSGRINREEALQVKYMIESTKTPIIGVALNNIEASSPDYYYYYYYGGYGYGSRQRRKRVKLKR